MAATSRGSTNFVPNDRRPLIKAEKTFVNGRDKATRGASGTVTSGGTSRGTSVTPPLSTNAGRSHYDQERAKVLKSSSAFNSFTDIEHGRDFQQHFNPDDSSCIISYSLDANRKRDVVDLSVERNICTCCGGELSKAIIPATGSPNGIVTHPRDMIPSQRPETGNSHHINGATRLQRTNGQPTNNQDRHPFISDVHHSSGRTANPNLRINCADWDSPDSRVNPNSHVNSSSPRTNYLAEKRAIYVADQIRASYRNSSNAPPEAVIGRILGVKRSQAEMSTSSHGVLSGERELLLVNAPISRQESSGSLKPQAYIYEYHSNRISDDDRDGHRSNDANVGPGRMQGHSWDADHRRDRSASATYSDADEHWDDRDSDAEWGIGTGKSRDVDHGMDRSASPTYSDADGYSDDDAPRPSPCRNPVRHHNTRREQAMLEGLHYLKWRQCMNKSVLRDPSTAGIWGDGRGEEHIHPLDVMGNDVTRRHVEARLADKAADYSNITSAPMTSAYVNSDFKGNEAVWDQFDHELYSMKHFIFMQGGCVSHDDLQPYLSANPRFLEKMNDVLSQPLNQRKIGKAFQRNPAWGMYVTCAVLEGKFVRRPLIYSIEVPSTKSRNAMRSKYPLRSPHKNPARGRDRQSNSNRQSNENRPFRSYSPPPSSTSPPPKRSRSNKKNNRDPSSNHRNSHGMHSHTRTDENGSGKRRKHSKKGRRNT